MSRLSLIFTVIISMVVVSCKKDAPIKLPISVTTDSVNSIDWTTAKAGGDVQYDGGSFIFSRGVVWDTNPNPQVSLKSKTSDGVGTGNFKSDIKGLIANKKYYLRSYAINSTDTMYGDEVTFRTSSWTPNDIGNVFDWWDTKSGVLHRSGKVYVWNGHRNNFLLPYGEYNLATYNEKDTSWGNEPSVTINPSNLKCDAGYYTKASAKETSKTVIVVSKVSVMYNNSPVVSLGFPYDNRFGLWVSKFNSYLFYDSYVPYYYGGKFDNGSYQIVRITYDMDKGGTEYFVSKNLNLSEKVAKLDSKSGRKYNQGKFNVGGYDDDYGYSPKMSVVEILLVDGVPTDKELSTYEKYLKYRYGR